MEAVCIIFIQVADFLLDFRGHSLVWVVINSLFINSMITSTETKLQKIWFNRREQRFTFPPIQEIQVCLFFFLSIELILLLISHFTRNLSD